MKLTLLLGLATALLQAQSITPQPVMTNATVEAMVRGGVSPATIFQAIKAAPEVDFLVNNQEAFALISAGAQGKVGDQILEAMHQRMVHGPAKQEPPAPAPAAVTAAPLPLARGIELVTPTPVRSEISVQPVRRIVLEDSTPVRLRISRNLSSADARTGDTIDFEVLEEVRVGNQLVIPKGSIAWGTVTNAEAKRRMARGGKLDVTIDAVRLADGERTALRGDKQLKGGGHVGGMATGIVVTSLVMWPAAPLFLLMHGKDTTIPKGTEITAYINGNANLDGGRFQSDLAPAQ